MAQQILVPLDGSSLAEAVLPCAAALARATSSALTLLRALPPLALIEPIGGAIYRGDAFWDAYQEEPDACRDYLASVAVRLEQDGLAVQTKVMEGDAATCILEYASANPDVRFIAMATHGRSGVGRLLFGSVAERVLRASPVPVLMLRSCRAVSGNIELQNPACRYRHILVPLDGSELAEEAIEQARRLATHTCGESAASLNGGRGTETHGVPALNGVSGRWAEITLLSVASRPSAWELADPTLFPLRVETSQDEKARQVDQYLFGVAQQLRDEGLRVKTQVKSGDPAEEIVLAGGRDDIDLIVMSTHGRGGLQRLWLGSVAMSVVQGANRAVLLVRAGNQPKKASAHKTEKEAVGNLAR